MLRKKASNHKKPKKDVSEIQQERGLQREETVRKKISTKAPTHCPKKESHNDFESDLRR